MKIAMTGALAASGVMFGCVYIWAQDASKSAGDPTPHVTTSPTNVLNGPTLYKMYCAVCHGVTAKGDGPMAKMLTGKTPDLTRIAERHGGKFPRAQVDRIISGEDQLPAGHGTREMPIWGPVFSQIAWDMDLGRVRVDNVARYLESLQVQ